MTRNKYTLKKIFRFSLDFLTRRMSVDRQFHVSFKISLHIEKNPLFMLCIM